MYRLGIDLGGTNIAVAVVDENYNIVGRAKVKTDAHRPAEEICDSKSSLAKLAEPIHLYPQFLKNVRVKNKAAVLADAKVLKAKEEVEKLINKKGRVLLRESGTEPVIRVMVEAEAQELCVAYAEMIVKVITEGGHCVE